MKALFRIMLVLGCLLALVIIFIGVVFRDRRPRIYFAAEDGDTNAIAVYLAKGHDVNSNINCYPFSERVQDAPLLDVAVQNGQIETVDFLLKRGANPNAADSRGSTPLMWVIGQCKNGVPQEERMQMFRMLLNAGSAINAPAPSEYRYTPLIEAASLGQTEMVRVLLDASADVKATNSIGQTALHLVGSHAEVAKLLLTAGADIGARDKYGLTPPDYSIRDGYTNILAILTNASANTKR